MKILITGGARRVGEMLVQQLAAAGHAIGIHCNRSIKEARLLCESIGGESAGHSVFQADMSDLKEAENFIESCVLKWGVFDVLINSASTYYRRGMSDIKASELDEDFKINFMAPFLLMQNYYRLCPGGQIINILDKRVNWVEPAAGPYALAKKSLRDATLACAQEWQGRMRVNGLALGEVLAGGEEYNQLTPLLKGVLDAVVSVMEGDKSAQVRVL